MNFTSIEEKHKSIASVQGQERRRPKRQYLLIVFGLLMIVSLLLTAGGYALYAKAYVPNANLAQTSAGHLQKAINLLTSSSQQSPNSHLSNQAATEFRLAAVGFQQLAENLQSFAGPTAFVPVLGSRVSTAQHLARLAADLSLAGVTGCQILNVLPAKLQGWLHPSAKGPSLADLASTFADFQQIKADLQSALGEAEQIPPGDLGFGSRINNLFATFRREMPTMQAFLATIDKLPSILPTILGIGTPTNYLIELMDSTEIRPTGGFIGNYGIATLSNGKLASAHITDVDLLDRPFDAAGNVIPFPPQYGWFSAVHQLISWDLRDSNMEADFPTAARSGESHYAQEGGNVPVQGVIAITPALIQRLMAITGPIYLPEYGETVTVQNLIDRIHYHQLGAGVQGSERILAPGGHSSLRKQFTELLSEHFIERLHALPSADLPAILAAEISAFRAKDIQVYFNNPDAEKLLQALHLDGTIQSPATGDSLFIVNSNDSGSKASPLIANTVNDQITIDNNGNATHHTTLTYSWSLPGQNYGWDVFYRDDIRIYAPPGSQLQQQTGWQALGINQAFGRQVWAGMLIVPHGQSRTINLVWTVPGAAKQDAQGWHYQYLLQRQATMQENDKVTIQFPSCASVTNTWGGLIADGQRASFAHLLTGDVTVGADYNTCWWQW